MIAENWGLLGHTWAVELLKGQITGDGLRHAYLFTGPNGVGRRTLALRLAQAVNCENPPSAAEFCGECRACRGFAQMGHPDLHLVQVEEGDRDIKVEAVRELSRMLALTPYESPYQIALLLNFEQASVHAANALLKTLEEPAGRVLLLLTAESAEALPETIASRCEEIRLRPVPVEALAKGLAEGWGIPAERARLLASLSGGRPGYALQLQQEPEALAQRTEWLDEVTGLLSQGRVARFAYAEALSKDRDQLREALLVWLSLWRDVLLTVGQAEGALANVDRAAEVAALAGQLDLGRAWQVVAAIEGTLELLGTNVNARLATEALLLKMPQITA
ncbi:MAG: DNA polymerase III subunit delta' [Chloroflexi bacterium]|nr:DNA polymerase III subunit delta' [Chloroflexota bacterium]